MTTAIIILAAVAAWTILSFWPRASINPATKNHGPAPKPRPPAAPDHGDNAGWP